ncbi:serine protease, partial [Micromonospora zhanjiangensis]
MSDQPFVPRPVGRLSRRRLLAVSALAAAAVPLGAGPRPAPALGDDTDDSAYQKVFDDALAADKDVRRYQVRGREILYRPRQLLAADTDVKRVATWLREQGLPPTVEGRFAGVTRLLFATEVDVPGIVTKLRDPRQWPGQSVPAVQPHHVLLGLGNIMGNPGGPPRVAAPLAAPDPA